MSSRQTQTARWAIRESDALQNDFSLVDYKGDVHLSESNLCPSFGNVNDDYMLEIFNNLRNAKPCCQCALGKKFLTSENIKIQVARHLLGFEEPSK